jgi:DNA-binding transcriptional regulator YbjK
MTVQLYQGACDPDDPLIGAMLTRMAMGGMRIATARSVAQQAGLSAALVGYRYGGMDGLKARAFVAADLRGAVSWQSRRDLLVQRPDVSSLGGLVLAVARDVGMREQELWRVGWMDRCARLRQPKPSSTPRATEEAAAEFWVEAADGMGLPADFASVLAGFCDGLAFGYGVTGGGGGFEVWATTLATRFAQRMAGEAPQAAGDCPYRIAAEGEGGWEEETIEPAAAPHPTRQAILRAAIAMVTSEGTDALTHRALAARAGVSLSSVQHFLPKRADILRATYQAVYQLLKSRTPSGSGVPSRASGDLDAEALATLVGGSADNRAILQELAGLHDLMLSASLDPESRGVARALYARTGQTSQRLLDRLASPRGPISRLDAQIFRLTTVGAWLMTESVRPGVRKPDSSLLTLKSLFTAR